MKFVSIAERKQFRICKTQKHKNAKTQKCKKVLNQFSQLTKKSAYFAAKSKKANRKSGLYIVRKCAENIPLKAKWDTPNGEMGHPKRRNGISQKAKWDTPNGEMGHPKRQNGTSQRRFGGIGAWITRWINKGRLKNGRADSRFVFAFLCFCK